MSATTITHASVKANFFPYGRDFVTRTQILQFFLQNEYL